MSGPFAYFNNGFSYRAVDKSYVAVGGEVLFADYATTQQLTNAFPDYAADLAVQEAEMEAAEALSSPITLSSTSTPALDGEYSISPQQQGAINAIVTYILLNGSFPGSAATLPWPDVAGEIHTFTSLQLFKEFSTAVADYVAALTIYANTGGQMGSLPSSDITIS